MTELVRDGFNGAPGDDLTNYKWAAQPGSTGVMLIGPDGESACGTTSTATASYIRPDVVPPNPDYFAYVDVTLLATLTNAAAVGVTSHASSTAFTHYQLRFVASVNAPNGTWQLRRIINNSATLLASMAGTFSAGQTTNIGIGTSGNLVSGYLDKNPTPILGPAASTLTEAGFGGILSGNAPASRARFDNFVVDDGLAAGQAGNATVTGVAANPAVGVVSASGAAVAAVPGVAASPAAGQVSARGGATATVIGVAATPAAGTVSAIGAASVTVTGVSTAPAVGEVTAHGGATAIITGVAANPAVGTVTAAAGGAGNAIVTGVAANPAVGTIVATGSARAIVGGVSQEIPPVGVPIGGVAANPAVGQVRATGGATGIVIGVAANPAAGQVIASAPAGGRVIRGDLVSPTRTVKFEGSRRRVAFEGSRRVVLFD